MACASWPTWLANLACGAGQARRRLSRSAQPQCDSTSDIHRLLIFSIQPNHSVWTAACNMLTSAGEREGLYEFRSAAPTSLAGWVGVVTITYSFCE